MKMKKFKARAKRVAKKTGRGARYVAAAPFVLVAEGVWVIGKCAEGVAVLVAGVGLVIWPGTIKQLKKEVKKAKKDFPKQKKVKNKGRQRIIRIIDGDTTYPEIVFPDPVYEGDGVKYDETHFFDEPQPSRYVAPEVRHQVTYDLALAQGDKDGASFAYGRLQAARALESEVALKSAWGEVAKQVFRKGSGFNGAEVKRGWDHELDSQQVGV